MVEIATIGSVSARRPMGALAELREYVTTPVVISGGLGLLVGFALGALLYGGARR
jgi:hypothetical protein